MGLKKKIQEITATKGLIAVGNIINEAIDKNIKFLTLYIFDLKLEKTLSEVNYLFNLLSDYIDKEINNLLKKDIKIKKISDIKNFPKLLKNKIKNVEKITSKNKKIQINMALNYGSRQEIINSIKILKKKKT